MCRKERMVQSQAVELDDGHGDGGDQTRRSSALTRKEETEKQKQGRSRQIYQIGFCFGTQDTIEGVSVFRIDSRTTKRGNLRLSGYRVPLGDMILAYALGT